MKCRFALSATSLCSPHLWSLRQALASLYRTKFFIKQWWPRRRWQWSQPSHAPGADELAVQSCGVPAASPLLSVGAARPYITLVSRTRGLSGSPGPAEAGWHGRGARWKAGGLREGLQQLLLQGWPARPWFNSPPTSPQDLQTPLAPQRTSRTCGTVEQDGEGAAPRRLVCPAWPNNSTLPAGLLHEICRFLQISSATTTRVRPSILLPAATNPYDKIPWGEAGNSDGL